MIMISNIFDVLGLKDCVHHVVIAAWITVGNGLLARLYSTLGLLRSVSRGHALITFNKSKVSVL